jgi:hypothetical protein
VVGTFKGLDSGITNEMWPLVFDEEEGDDIKTLEMTMNCGC